MINTTSKDTILGTVNIKLADLIHKRTGMKYDFFVCVMFNNDQFYEVFVCFYKLQAYLAGTISPRPGKQHHLLG